MTNTAPAMPRVANDLLRPFMEAVVQVFATMVSTQVTVSAPRPKIEVAIECAVSGIVGLSGEFTGSVVISFSEASAVKVVESFAGCRADVGTAEFADAVGELANLVAGGAKQRLGGVASISLPSVVIGREYSIAANSDVPCMIIPCESPLGSFALQVCIKRNKVG